MPRVPDPLADKMSDKNIQILGAISNEFEAILSAHDQGDSVTDLVSHEVGIGSVHGRDSP